ncbi:hypothetical protein VTN02DRAFT_6716 [Thermoascus thermophilus]
MLIEFFIVLELLTENYDCLPAVKTTVICPSQSYHQIDQSEVNDNFLRSIYLVMKVSMHILRAIGLIYWTVGTVHRNFQFLVC